MEQTIDQIIGNKIKEFRVIRNISQNELAKALGYSSNGMLSQVENGTRSMHIRRIPNLSKKLKIPIRYFFLKKKMSEKNLKRLVEMLDQNQEHLIDQKFKLCYKHYQ